VLKDCFTSPRAKTVMIATVSPGASACDHTLNTLRYADRIKQQKLGQMSEAAKNDAARMEQARRQAAQQKREEAMDRGDYPDADFSPPPAPPAGRVPPKGAPKSKENSVANSECCAGSEAGEEEEEEGFDDDT
jgi:hypothetical protein